MKYKHEIAVNRKDFSGKHFIQDFFTFFRNWTLTKLLLEKNKLSYEGTTIKCGRRGQTDQCYDLDNEKGKWILETGEEKKLGDYKT